jgi:hypothetical protein
MNTVTLLGLATAMAALAAAPAHAQFVKGNEAVRMTATGKVVATPKAPASVSRLCRADAKCHAGAWHMVETADGLMECTEPFARPGTCRSSSFGTKRLSRVWVVNSGGKWLWCQYPDLGSKCVDMFARPPANLPQDAVQ